jgi:tetratricopeptide (TPR) repeat protein
MRYLLLLLPILFPFVGLGQNNDAIKITELRVALEKYNDCKNALAALQEVFQNGQSNPLFHLYAGKTYDCLANFDKAIYYYELYLKTYPSSSDILQRVAELRYQKRKKENKYNLAGTWYPEGEPETIRKINQYGNTVKLYDPAERGEKGIKFQGTLQITGVFKGGRFWYFTKISKPDEDNRSVWHLTCSKCVFTKMEYHERDEEFSEQTSNDVLTLSPDGNSITIKQSYPTIVLAEKRVEYEGETKNLCVCELEWKTQYITYVRVVN